jgi:hypothetical protein
MLGTGDLFSRYCGEGLDALQWRLVLEALRRGADNPPVASEKFGLESGVPRPRPDEQDPVVHTAASTPVGLRPITHLPSSYGSVGSGM